MFYSLKGKFQVVQDGISAGLRNLKGGDEKSNSGIPHVDYNAGAEVLDKKEKQWDVLRNLAVQNYQKAQEIDEQITKTRNTVLKQWSHTKEINQFVLTIPQFTNTMKTVNENLVSLQNLVVGMYDALDSLEDLIEKRELHQKQLEEKFNYSTYLAKMTAENEVLKAKLQMDHSLQLLEHEKRNQVKLKERQELFDIAFRQDLQLYKESSILPTLNVRKNEEQKLSLEDIEIEQNEESLKDLNELLND